MSSRDQSQKSVCIEKRLIAQMDCYTAGVETNAGF